jgi:hypothetical protein
MKKSALSMVRRPPVDVFYVVQSTGARRGEREYRLCSALYETLLQAETEMSRLRNADSGGSYEVWRSVRYVEPTEWLHRVVRIDGTLILPRLHGVEKFKHA